ncbi:hypothetical protein D3C72_2487390 [compost metagenome]
MRVRFDPAQRLLAQCHDPLATQVYDQVWLALQQRQRKTAKARGTQRHVLQVNVVAQLWRYP